jgi:hypothetical protein
MAVFLTIAIQQAFFGLAWAASFRQPESWAVDDTDPDSLNLTASSSDSSYPPPWDVTCNRNTGRMCEAAMAPGKSVVDYLGQCDQGASEHCSTGHNFPAGYCVCAPGWCADGHGKCTQQRSVVVAKVFQISVQQFGTAQKLYMLPNGKVMLGTPRSPSQAQWRIVVAPDGVMKLFTNAYPSRLLDSYEHCIKFTEVVKCQTLVGSTWQPPAKDTGWKLDHSGEHSGTEKFEEAGEYVFLRDFHSSKRLYVHHLTHEVHLCSPSDYNCPGPFGNLQFTPSIHGHVEIPITYPPPTTFENIFQWIGMIVIILVAIFLCVMNARLDNKITHLDDNMLTGPANCLRAVVTCDLCGHSTRGR